MFNVLSQVLAHIMENFLLCGELGIPQDQATYSTAQLHSGVYKGRKKGTVEFVGIWKYGKREKEYVENGVSQVMFPARCYSLFLCNLTSIRKSRVV